MITVSKNNDGDFSSIQAAVDAAQDGEKIFVKSGCYKERVEITTANITIVGEDAESTILENNYYARMIMPDGEKRGTFRSYTMLINSNNFTCKNMTIMNSAGFGSEVGQAVAVYAEGDGIFFEDCGLIGHQDTLFTGPLPEQEYEKGGFRGPTEFAERVQGRQLYRRCYISGEVDFIFGSAEAYFDDCDIFSYNCNKEVNGYVTAASTYKDWEVGYVFNNCRLISDCPENTVYLGRPWRDYAKTVFIGCDFGAHIHGDGFHDWNKENAREAAFYAVYNCKKNGAEFIPSAPFAKTVSEEYVNKLLQRMNALSDELSISE
ncbi:MAG: pectin methylesterase [Oscillospiraceae bacterium]|nr:pectin methylesterase [Oscillospiraceae bacterium]